MLRNVLCCFFLSPFISVLLYSQGSSVSINLTNDSIVSGELLSVRSNGLIISTIEGLSESELSNHQSSIIVVQNERIISLTVKGTSRILVGSGLGLVIGASGGMILGLMSGDDPPGFMSATAEEKGGMLAVVCGGLGIIFGTIDGIVNSTPERTIEPLPGSGFLSIRKNARYPYTEPDFIFSLP
ncbi:MAG: hypothetical protein ACOYNS_07045 [Bacteroidota bacterium]